MDALLVEVKKMAAAADEVTRRKVCGALQEAIYSLEEPLDLAIRISGMHLGIAIMRIGADLDIYRILAENEAPLNVSTLAKKTNAAPELLGRLLRHMAANGVIKESGKDEFTANKSTRLLADPEYKGAIYHGFDNIGPVVQALPEFLKDSKYQDMTDPTKTAFQKAYNTDQPTFSWMAQHPERMGWVKQTMSIYRLGNWVDSFPVEESIRNWNSAPDRVVFVDVGGSGGHQSVMLKEKHPNLPGRIILQDLPETLQHVKPIEGIEIMPQNFFETQAVKGAKFYYLRAILHDYPDELCVKILQNIASVLAEDSRILIDEVVLPDSGIPWQATLMDLTMMASFAAKERTRAQWDALMESAGMKILRVYTYNSSLRNSVLEVVPK